MNPTNEEARIYIDSINFDPVMTKLVNFSGWLLEDAEKTCRQYRNFLFLNKKYHDQHKDLPPSEDIDEFWHNHILDTEQYIKDCQHIFGSYMHHYPYFGIDDKTNLDDLNKAFVKTKELYLQEFDEPLEATRSSYPKLIYYILKKFEKFSCLLNGYRKNYI